MTSTPKTLRRDTLHRVLFGFACASTIVALDSLHTLMSPARLYSLAIAFLIISSILVVLGFVTKTIHYVDEMALPLSFVAVTALVYVNLGNTVVVGAIYVVMAVIAFFVSAFFK